MKYLHINQWDTRGGSARVSLRLHMNMLQRGIDSHLMVSGRTGIPREPISNSSLLAEEPWLRWMDDKCRATQKVFHKEDLFFPSSWMLPLRQRFKQADIVQVYGLSGGYFAYPTLPSLSAQKPLIWWMTDPWPLTGGCCYPGACTSWLSGCENCDCLVGNIGRKELALKWRHKQRVYDKTNALVVAPSRWLYNMAKQSPLMRSFKVEYVPNGVDTEIFKALDRKTMRELWNIPPDARVIMISTSTFSDPRKGALLIGSILGRIRELSGDIKIHVLFVGRRQNSFEKTIGQLFPFTTTGFVEEARLMATLYNAADLLLHPSLDENLSNMTCDCMACGTPVFCFDVGGMRDIILDGENGLAARAGDCTELADKLVNCLRGQYLPENHRRICNDTIIQGFTVEQETAKILNLAQQLIEERVSGHCLEGKQR